MKAFFLFCFVQDMHFDTGTKYLSVRTVISTQVGGEVTGSKLAGVVCQLHRNKPNGQRYVVFQINFTP